MTDKKDKIPQSLFSKPLPHLFIIFCNVWLVIILAAGVTGALPASPAYAMLIESVSPASNVLKVVANANIVVKFNKDISSVTADGKLFINGSVSGSHETIAKVSGKTVTFDPVTNFIIGEMVTVTLTTGIKSTAGDSPESPKTWQFFTAGSQKTNPYFFDSGQNLGSSASVAFGDIDKDEDLDIVLANAGATKLWLNDEGTFADSGQNLGAGADVVLGDVDDDGDLDAVLATAADTKIWLNNEGTFTDSGQTLGAGVSLALGDIDGDGDSDAVIANSGGDSTVWRNNGGTFTDSGQTLALISDVALGDVDDDGDLDAVVVNSAGGSTVWMNQSGIFTESDEDLSSGSGVALGDFDDDGDPDAFVANSSVSKVWINDGGTFTDSGQSLGPGTDVALGDLDGDGDLDAVLGGSSATVWINNGGIFTKTESSKRPSGSGVGVAVGDIGGDGLLDIVLANAGSTRIWLNNRPPKIKEGATTTEAMEENGPPIIMTLNASDPDENEMRWQITTSPEHGTVSGGGTGTSASVTYDSDTDYTGKDTFIVQVNDGLDTAEITVTVNIGTIPPVIEPDENSVSVVMDEDASPQGFSLTLEASTPRKPADTMTWSIITAPGHGDASIIGDNTDNPVSLAYTPEENFDKTDSFVVQVANSKGETDRITVYADITPHNDPPEITGQKTLATEEKRPLSISLYDLMVNDPDSFFPGDFTLTVQDGANYICSGNTITPVDGFVNGILTVPVIVNDSSLDSNLFNLSVEVLPFGTLTADEKGDIDDNGEINIGDAILALWIMTEADPNGDSANLDADINGDGKIGIEDIIFILNSLRPGDINRNGRVDVGDAILSLQILTGADLGDTLSI